MKKIKDLKDNEAFFLTIRYRTKYRLQKKNKKEAVITSVNSGRTYTVSVNAIAYTNKC